MKKISEAQVKAIRLGFTGGGELVRYPGGFWSVPGAKLRQKVGYQVPEVWTGTETIEALVKRKLAEVIERKVSHGGSSFPVRVRISSEVRAMIPEFQQL